MSYNNINEFIEERNKLNKLIYNKNNLTIKRFFNLDSNVYKNGALCSKTKELIGLISSLVLRCDDCINYHLTTCFKNGVTDDELEEAVAIGLIVGGSITIPHIRRLFKMWEDLKNIPKS